MQLKDNICIMHIYFSLPRINSMNIFGAFSKVSGLYSLQSDFQHNLVHLFSFIKEFVSSHDKNKSGSLNICAEQ